MSWEIFVFKEGGWRNLGVSAAYCRCWSLGIPKDGRIPPPGIVPGEVIPPPRYLLMGWKFRDSAPFCWCRAGSGLSRKKHGQNNREQVVNVS